MGVSPKKVLVRIGDVDFRPLLEYYRAGLLSSIDLAVFNEIFIVVITIKTSRGIFVLHVN